MTDFDAQQDEMDLEGFTSDTEETKADRFKRVAKIRYDNAMKALKLLKQCSNSVNYEPNPAVVDLMLVNLEERIAEVRAAYQPQQLETQNPFEL